MRFLAGLVTLTLASSANAETLWQNVELGMTVEQLKAARPGVHEIPADEKSHYLTDCSYVDTPTTINSLPMEVCYDVEAGKVTGVALHSGEIKVIALADSVKDLLAGKYGPPAFDHCDQDSVLASCATTWQRGGVKITAKRITALGEAYLTIRYQGIGGDDASKL